MVSLAGASHANPGKPEKKHEAIAGFPNSVVSFQARLFLLFGRAASIHIAFILLCLGM
jgi:hypothetical protein